MQNDPVYDKALRAGRRTYFFDVRETRGGDYYLTITESKKNFDDDGNPYYKKHKIYLYKEDFSAFREVLAETTDFVIREKGEEVISERHDRNYKPQHSHYRSSDQASDTPPPTPNTDAPQGETAQSRFTDVDFD